jgi:hypothetical protein
MPNAYMYGPPPPNSNIPKNGQNTNPQIPPNMGMYMPFPMDSRYPPYMNYEYMHKKP